MPSNDDIAAGASGMPLTPEDKNEIADAPKEKDKPKRGRPKKKSAETEVLERRIAQLEETMAVQAASTHSCHMCHKPGATTQRGNTGEWFHGTCLADYRQGKDPLPH